jgi:hypothetical protein
MATEKDIALIDYLLTRTEGGTIQWEPTAVREQFTTSFKGKYSVLIDKNVDEEDDGAEHYWLTLKDSDDRELLKVWSNEVPVKLRTMYQLAQRQSLNVDTAIDEIITSEGSSKEIRDEDIPF